MFFIRFFSLKVKPDQQESNDRYNDRNVYIPALVIGITSEFIFSFII